MGSIERDIEALQVEEGQKDHVYPMDLFKKAKEEGRPLWVSAPMVRYSKLAFRQTVHSYGTDLTYTPMILAKEFNRSPLARASDFTLPPSPISIPTIVQLGATSPLEFARATSMLLPYCSGVDLNCGCPQSWACAEGLGAALMERPELVRDIVRAGREVVRKEGWEGKRTVSVKIRVHKDLEKTKEFLRIVQEAGPDLITVHGRTKSTRSSVPVNEQAVAALSPHIHTPFLFNGDIASPHLGRRICSSTGAWGVMSARDILVNPALFSPEYADKNMDWSVVERFLNFVVKSPLPFKLVVHHLNTMVEGGKGGSPGGLGLNELGGRPKALLGKEERARLMGCRDMLELIDFLDEVRGVRRL